MASVIPAIILAGGLGTRLRAVVPDIPKPMANVAGKPFLWWVLRRLEQQGLSDIYLAVGYKHETIKTHFGAKFGSLALHYVVEDAPLGTGGAIAQAMSRIDCDMAYVLNGDTIATIDLARLDELAATSYVELVMAVTKVNDIARYGAVEFDAQSHRITAFREKGQQGTGYINAGVYLIKRDSFLQFAPGERFSFEQDYLHARVGELCFVAQPDVSQFIDIGVPEDYRLAQIRVPEMTK